MPVEPDPHQGWFPSSKRATVKLPAHISPSMLPTVASATLGRQLELGPRLRLQGNLDAELLGIALHNIFAADLIVPNHVDRASMVARVLKNHALLANMSVEDVLVCSSRFQQCLTENFRSIGTCCEWPVSMVIDNRQRMNGWVDVLLETEMGWIIVDNKSFPGRNSDLAEKALTYSGQLDAYRHAVERATVKPVISQWIHFSIGGALIEIEFH